MLKENSLPNLKHYKMNRTSRNSKFITLARQPIFKTEVPEKPVDEETESSIYYPHKSLKLSNRIRKIQSRRRLLRHTSQKSIRPKDRRSVYPSSYFVFGKENIDVKPEHPENKILLNLKSYMTEDEKEELIKAFDSDEEQQDPDDKYVGEQAIIEYYDKYKRFSIDSQKCKRTPEKIQLYNVPPTPSGLIKRSGSEKDMNVRDYNLSKPYVSALSSSMKDMNIKNLTLSTINNNEEGITEVFSNLCPGVEKLNCSNSSIGELSLLKLCCYMKEGFRQNNLNLKLINLSNNKISDEAAVKFF